MIALTRILVATDFGEPSAAALRYGVELARRFQAQLHLLHVVDDLAAHPYSTLPGAVDFGPLQTEIEEAARTHLATLLSEADRSTLHARVTTMTSASPALAILNYARDEQIDLIIVGTHGRYGLARVFLGSVARHVSGAAECPVLTVRAHERDFVHPDVDRNAADAARSDISGR